ncbi:hypothetical protein R1flu_016340 [Riccia fluitans]|uniref:U1 small nuclear ribonucleoprotein C n=1 Tax=Riccia fluitans TaxID=41844 RepID=A0ABD1YLL1_9MARC
MPRYYCDYCDTYLTHDSPSVRTQHNAGYKHKANVRAYYQQFEEQQTQSLIDQKVKEHLGQAAAGGGTAFQQHLAALQAGQFKPPLLGTAPGSLPSSQPPLLPNIRLPVLPPPTSGSSGYGNPSGVQYQYRPSPAGNAQQNGMPVPPTLTPPGAPARQAAPPSNSSGYGSLVLRAPIIHTNMGLREDKLLRTTHMYHHHLEHPWDTKAEAKVCQSQVGLRTKDDCIILGTQSKSLTSSGGQLSDVCPLRYSLGRLVKGP